MKLYTRQGDDGTTGLIGGARVSKDCTRVAAYGDVDETNAAIGVTVSSGLESKAGEILLQIQSDLFNLGAHLASRDSKASLPGVGSEQVRMLEEWIDWAVADLPQLTSFILPGGSASAAALHYARTVCRRAERSVTTLANTETIDPQILIYLNRLSDLLFALARRANFVAGIDDIPWTAT